MKCALTTLPIAIAAMIGAVASPAGAQAPTPPSPPGSVTMLAPYRAPVIALVQPPGGGTVPLDRPAVVFRFAAGEPDDPLDLGSLLVAVDGADRTALFQSTATQAWGPLADAETLRRGAFAAGPHRVTARICSSRGACTTAEAQVLAQPGPVVTTAIPLDAVAAAKPSTVRRVLGAVVGVARKLLAP